ncbi:hypothetical protein NLM33_28545 [Bradyrhizobium sp. CCGUVB1N3]|uniref:hypothetical protein n=1 Tax=Bradyrhizobium sp. CCGUVB1N3 TaxID=2949629 RepID=UPI0020B1ED34|nr:hypothetical protein [Bradyrhizobium sp. CCGUVB1N3]MCP3474270.1 hypothetical protein [Bradyrhizobium sp. CCGUVB1N3]
MPVIKKGSRTKIRPDNAFMRAASSIIWNALKLLEKARIITGLIAGPVHHFHFGAGQGRFFASSKSWLWY